MQIFYNGLTYITNLNVDAAIGRALMEKLAQEAQQLIEEMATNSYQWATKRSNNKRPAVRQEIDTLSMSNISSRCCML